MSVTRSDVLKVAGITAAATAAILLAREGELFLNYLPIALSNYTVPYRLGVHEAWTFSGAEQYMVPNRMYQVPINWDMAEKERGKYTMLKAWNTNAAIVARNGGQLILTVKMCPDWAKAWDQKNSPPKPEYYADYARFCQMVIDRYHPWAIELWNEPDMQRSKVENPAENNWYGAWVDDIAGETWEDGGTRYGECMRLVTEQVTGAKIIVGALASHSKSIPFLQAAFAAGMGGDALSYHCYVPYSPINAFFNRPFELANNFRAVTDLPLLMTETSMLSRGSTQDEATPEFLQAQADYLRWVLDHLPDSEVSLVNWFILANHQWRNCGLIEYGQQKPAYEVWRGWSQMYNPEVREDRNAAYP